MPPIVGLRSDSDTYDMADMLLISTTVAVTVDRFTGRSDQAHFCWIILSCPGHLIVRILIITVSHRRRRECFSLGLEMPPSVFWRTRSDVSDTTCCSGRGLSPMISAEIMAWKIHRHRYNGVGL